MEEILNDEELFFNLESVLGRFVDVDTTLSLLVQVCTIELSHVHVFVETLN